ncbi:MAG: glycerophosphodiester phosphodiesterase family protein, partial [Sulfurimonadaceae bacterium]|nr:glycerophosphodiester phosphodiesterase family protein [Sulfurimonadaceae bacterium]
MNSGGLIAAHRGNRAVAPENTLAAFRKSIGRCDLIELDVQLSRDGVPVVIHDETLERTSNVSEFEELRVRKPWPVNGFTLDELKGFDFGSWFHREDPFGQLLGHHPDVEESYAGELIPTLEEVLHFAYENEMLLNVEIKDMHGLHDDETVVRSIVGMIEDMGCADRVLLSSFYHPYMKLAKEVAPQVPASALQELVHPDDLLQYLHSLKVDGYHLDDAITDRETVSLLKSEGFFVGVYTVNDKARREELFSWGVDAVFTDLP